MGIGKNLLDMIGVKPKVIEIPAIEKAWLTAEVEKTLVKYRELTMKAFRRLDITQRATEECPNNILLYLSTSAMLDGTILVTIAAEMPDETASHFYVVSCAIEMDVEGQLQESGLNEAVESIEARSQRLEWFRSC